MCKAKELFCKYNLLSYKTSRMWYRRNMTSQAPGPVFVYQEPRSISMICLQQAQTAWTHTPGRLECCQFVTVADSGQKYRCRCNFLVFSFGVILILTPSLYKRPVNGDNTSLQLLHIAPIQD